MKEIPILFSAPMVRAILEGRKTQTRRVVELPMQYTTEQVGQIWKMDTDDACWFATLAEYPNVGASFNCRYGTPSARLWVKETYGIACSSGLLVDPCVNYRADGGQLPLIGHSDPHAWSLACNRGRPGCEANDGDLLKVRAGWRPSIFAFRWTSRILLEIADVRVQRLQEISEEDAIAEGFGPRQAKALFRGTWEVLNSKRGFGWDKNPWVWALTFRRVTREG